MAMEKITVKNAAKSFSVNKARNGMSSVRLAPAQPSLDVAPAEWSVSGV